MKLALSVLLALAMLLMPAGMNGPAMAAAMPDHGAASAAGGHCQDVPEPDGDQPADGCCLIACSAMPAEPVALAPAPPPAFVHAAPVPAGLHGLSFEAATPPPRFS